MSSDLVVDVIIEDPRWAEIRLEALAQRACTAALIGARLTAGPWEISVLGCDDRRIAALNSDFRGTPKPTNVLSWPDVDRSPRTAGSDPDPPDPSSPALGDIAISYDTCNREAAAAGLEISDHVTHLLVHGTLHLLGFDHIDDKDAAHMEALEVSILASLGVADPY